MKQMEKLSEKSCRALDKSRNTDIVVSKQEIKTMTIGIISRKQALQISPDYVAFIEGDHSKFNVIDKAFQTLKRNQMVLTFDDGKFVIAKVTSINHDDIRAIDGPIVRVCNTLFSWRVDGDRYAVPLS